MLGEATAAAPALEFVTRGLILAHSGSYANATGNWADSTGISGDSVQSDTNYRPADYSYDSGVVPDFQNTGAVDANADWMTMPASLASLNNGAESTIMIAFIPRAASGSLFGAITAGGDKYNYELATDRVYSRVRDQFDQMLCTITTDVLHVATLVNAAGANGCKVGFDTTFQTYTRSTNTTATGAYLGRQTGAFGYFKGQMVGVRAHNVALTQPEIEQNLTKFGIAV